VHIGLNPQVSRVQDLQFLGSGSTSYLEEVPVSNFGSARVYAFAPARQNFTSHMLTAIVYSYNPTGFYGSAGTWDAIGSVTWTAGISFHAFDEPLAPLLQRFGGGIKPGHTEYGVEVDEMNGPKEVLLGATFFRIGSGSRTP
jgi:hypothetical protein